jgi:sugar O-acyltransferase (sialic acid O-acetyltransferase NeuD family)
MLKSENSLKCALEEITFLGCSVHTLPVSFDIAYECLGIRKFRIAKNIPVESEPILEFDKDLYSYTVHEPEEQIQMTSKSLFFGLVGSKGKSLVFEHFASKYGIDSSWFINLLHPTSYVSSSAALDKGILLEPGSIISSRASVGFGVTIKRGASIGHHAKIGAYSEINPGAVLCGRVHIGQFCTLGAGCVIRDGCSIGENTLIGMGSVVTQDIPSGVIAYGNPCKVMLENELWKI